MPSRRRGKPSHCVANAKQRTGSRKCKANRWTGDIDPDFDYPIRRPPRPSGPESLSYRCMPTGHTARDKGRNTSRNFEHRLTIQSSRDEVKEGIVRTPVTVLDIQPHLMQTGSNAYSDSVEVLGSLLEDQMPSDCLRHGKLEVSFRKMESWKLGNLIRESESPIQMNKLTGTNNFYKVSKELSVPIIGYVETRQKRMNNSNVADTSDLESYSSASGANSWVSPPGECPRRRENLRCGCALCRSNSRRDRRAGRPENTHDGLRHVLIEGRDYVADWTRIYAPRGTYFERFAEIKHPELPKGIHQLPTLRVTGSHSVPGLCVSNAGIQRVKKISRHLTISGKDYWAPENPNMEGDFLEVDLGSDRNITHVGTMGRDIPRARICLERCCQSQGIHAKTGCSQPQNKIWVVMPESKNGYSYRYRDHFQNSFSLPTDAYVIDYRLWARKEGEKEWRLLGTYIGNSDCTTEVLQGVGSKFGFREKSLRTQEETKMSSNELNKDGKGGGHMKLQGGLIARYLKFEPRRFHHAKAIRVAVYGPLSGKEKIQAKAAASFVTYQLEIPNQRRYRLHSRASGYRGCSCCRSDKYQGEGYNTKGGWRMSKKKAMKKAMK